MREHGGRHRVCCLLAAMRSKNWSICYLVRWHMATIFIFILLCSTPVVTMPPGCVRACTMVGKTHLLLVVHII
jgi:hypothetical protein